MSAVTAHAARTAGATCVLAAIERTQSIFGFISLKVLLSGTEGTVIQMESVVRRALMVAPSKYIRFDQQVDSLSLLAPDPFPVYPAKINGDVRILYNDHGTRVSMVTVIVSGSLPEHATRIGIAFTDEFQTMATSAVADPVVAVCSIHEIVIP